MANFISGILERANIFGKYIDQPALIKKAYNAMPPVLIAGATAYGLYDTFNNKKVKEGEESRLKRFIKNASVLTGTVAATLIFGKKFIELPHVHKCGINSVIKGLEGESKATLTPLLNRVKGGDILPYGDIAKLYYGLKDKGKNLMDKVIPSGHSHHHHGHDHGKKQGFIGRTFDNLFGKFLEKYPEFHEIKNLSILGTIPVLGGIAGGIIGDKLAGEKVKETLPNKIKEGTYQYLANIVLCNVGAGAALLAVNQTKYKRSKPVKFFGMLAGILAVGVAGGSLIANFIGKNVINPLVDSEKNIKKDNSLKGLYNERVPEAVDIGLHIDDVASAGFLSGLNIVAPALPVLYSVSAYRAGIGYRNNGKKTDNSTQPVYNGVHDEFYCFRERKFHYHNCQS